MIPALAVTLTLAATSLAGRTVYVQCLPIPADRWGEANLSGGWVHLQPAVCRTLLHPGRWRGTVRFAECSFVLAHEVGHIVLATDDERAADRYGLTNWIRLAWDLGMGTPTAAQELAAARWAR